MKKIAILVTILLFLSIGTFIYSKTSEIDSPTTITGLAVQDVKINQEKIEQKITGNYIKESVQEDVRVTPFYKTVIVPANGKEILITENGISLKILDSILYVRHSKLYNGRWVYVGVVINGNLKAFNGKIAATNIVVIGPETTGIKVKVSGAVSE